MHPRNIRHLLNFVRWRGKKASFEISIFSFYFSAALIPADLTAVSLLKRLNANILY